MSSVEQPGISDMAITPIQRNILRRSTEELARKSDHYGGMIFLDKGARPISFLYHSFCNKKEVAARPSILVNIGSETIRAIKRNVGGVRCKNDLWRLSADMLPSIFGEQNVAQLVQSMQLLLAHTNNDPLLIVDDLCYSGQTMMAARRIISLLFPQIRLDGHFVLDETTIDYFREGRCVPKMPWHHISTTPPKIEPENFILAQYDNERLIQTEMERIITGENVI